MAEAAELDRIYGPNDWYKDDKDDRHPQLYKARAKGNVSFRPWIERVGAPRYEAHFASPLRTVWSVAEKEDLAEQVAALADDLDESVEWVYQMALIEFLEGHDKDVGSLADALRRSSPYWQAHEYSADELDALLETDRLSPEMAERYKDLLED
jgi:hypothetical protein